MAWCWGKWDWSWWPLDQEWQHKFATVPSSSFDVLTSGKQTWTTGNLKVTLCNLFSNRKIIFAYQVVDPKRSYIMLADTISESRLRDRVKLSVINCFRVFLHIFLVHVFLFMADCCWSLTQTTWKRDQHFKPRFRALLQGYGSNGTGPLLVTVPNKISKLTSD